MSWRRGKREGEAEGWLCTQISIEVNTRVSMLFVREKRKKRRVDRFFFEGKKRERERGRESEIKREKRDTGTVLTRADPDIPPI
ncbi:hypothetical protein [Scardovia wiggsiae]|uniref:hypothetical protein n=1 Tax=Scardovia wiggsiae TaxID=230143 RepID=UPI00138965A7|nr:hypothetical protein [Scardovia wiggsiae]